MLLPTQILRLVLPPVCLPTMAISSASLLLLLLLIFISTHSHAHASDSDGLHRLISDHHGQHRPPATSNPCSIPGVNCDAGDLSGTLDLTGDVKHSSLRRSLVQNRYMLAENSKKKNGTTNGTTTTNTTSAAAPAESPEAAAAAHHRRKRHKIRNWAVGFVSGTLVGIVTGLLLSVLFRMVTNFIRGRYRGPGGPSIFSPQIIKRIEDLAFLEKEGGLASLEIIGRGGCGEVYRAQLSGDPGRTIAIKKIRRVAPEGSGMTEEDSHVLDKWMRQIRSEIRTVGQIRHRNLLPLLAHIPRPDCHYLVYDFMKNGSLHDVFVQERDLDWPARHKIAVGIVAGLEYLHHNHKPRIIHRDLKPANILIDDGMEARIADFGLAKEMPEAVTHMTTSNVAGTVGYIAPEYYQTLKFTAKCDVYSLGVILGVLVTGRMPSDEFFQETEEMSMVKWLWNVMGSGNPAAALDPKMVGNGYEEQMLLIARIACFCTAEDPKQRPNSKNVGAMLAQIKY